MPSYINLTPDEKIQELSKIEALYAACKQQKNNLNMTRGKPCTQQLNLSAAMMTCLEDDDYKAEDGSDCRNYGGLDGLSEARSLFAEMLGFKQEQLMVLGNASLNIMYDLLVKAMLFSLPGAEKPWSKHEKIRFLCPVPGYDRHFAITERLGFDMINIPMTEEGPDMDLVEQYAADPSVKGMWLVPVYSNPQGYTCSEKTCQRLAAMKTAPDFRLFWDNAYAVHHLDFHQQQTVPNIIELCEQAGHPDRVFAFASTSKITWAGAGIACLASSPVNLAYVKDQMALQTIGPDKVNQLRHVRFLKDQAGLEALMKKHAEILKPKFDLVDEILVRDLEGLEISDWLEPKGGYFVSVDVMPGIADEVVSLAKGCGVELTPAGSTHPYKKDPQNSTIRLAPSFPPLDELRQAMDVLTVCIRLAALRKLCEA